MLPSFQPESLHAAGRSLTLSSWESVDVATAVPTKWVPDHAATHCMGCDLRFWAVNRRHHCRACGKVFCSTCTGQETAVPGEQLYRPVRVCRACYDRLTTIPDARGTAGEWL